LLSNFKQKSLVRSPASVTSVATISPIASVAVSAAATATAKATPATTSTSAAAWLTFARFVYRERTAAHILAIKLGCCCIGILHLDKSETAGTARLTVADNSNRLDFAERREHVAEFFFGRRERQITDIQLLSHKNLLQKMIQQQNPTSGRDLLGYLVTF
jgi:hypothetical protein